MSKSKYSDLPPLCVYTAVAVEINETSQWKSLEAHATLVKELHLRDLLQDPMRCSALVNCCNDITLDYSRELVLPSTMVKMCFIVSDSRFACYLLWLCKGHVVRAGFGIKFGTQKSCDGMRRED